MYKFPVRVIQNFKIQFYIFGQLDIVNDICRVTF